MGKSIWRQKTFCGRNFYENHHPYIILKIMMIVNLQK